MNYGVCFDRMTEGQLWRWINTALVQMSMDLYDPEIRSSERYRAIERVREAVNELHRRGTQQRLVD